MNEKERFEALMKLADFRFERWRERRTYEWKVSMALWALLVAASAYLKAHGFAFPSYATALVLLIIVIGHAWFWVRTNWISGEMDIRTAFHFADMPRKSCWKALRSQKNDSTLMSSKRATEALDSCIEEFAKRKCSRR